MRNELEVDFDPTSPEAKFELRQQLVEDRQRELEAEQAKLEEERNKIEQRRLELEAEKERHAAERERLRQEAAEARQRAEDDRKRLEKERLEQEVEQERQKIAQKLAALEAEAAREREEQEQVEREAEAQRRRAEQRLQEIKAEQELRRAEQERITQEAKQQLEQAEQRLLELSGADLDIREPDPDPEPVEAGDNAVTKKAFETVTKADDEIVVPDFSGRSERPARSWHVPVIGAAALLVAGAVGAWVYMPTAGNPSPTGAVTQSAIAIPETRPAATEPSPAPEPPSIELPEETATTEVEPAETGQQHPISAVREKQKKPIAEKTAPRKKVTVDDLINDN